MPPVLVWFRQDLRLADNPALHAAAISGASISPIFIWSPEEEGDWPPGGATRWWLHRSLERLDADLRKLKSRLVFRRGPTLETLQALICETGATALFWNRRYEPAAIARDKKIKETLKSAGIQVESFNGSLLFEPWDVKTATGGPYRVFTPFWRSCLAHGEPSEPLPSPPRLPALEKWPASLALTDLSLQPRIPWDTGMREAWTPGSSGAATESKQFLSSALADYKNDRDRPDHNGTSRLSPYLHFGEISPRQIWHAVRAKAPRLLKGNRGAETLAEPYLRQLIWREFAYHLLYHFPQTPLQPLREEFAAFPWNDDQSALRAWQRGRTGYPYIDAGMRQLWTTGWMHNRVRMAVASFLVKDLLLPWQAGAKWFWDTLVDADLANNTLGWQWTAGCGADAAPYFRIFNPVSQGEKFDPQGDYIRRWVPELAKLPGEWIHSPWKAPAGVLRKAGVEPGDNYPCPIVDHGVARKRALEALASMKS